MSNAKIFFDEMLCGIRNYQTFADFCHKYRLWLPKGNSLNWIKDNYFVNRINEHMNKNCFSELKSWETKRDGIISRMRKATEKTDIDKCYQHWARHFSELTRIHRLPLFQFFSESLYYMTSFNGKGGLSVDPNWTVLINPKHLEGLDLIPEPDERVVFTEGNRIPLIIVGDSFGIVSENGNAFFSKSLDLRNVNKFLGLWDAGELEVVGNQLQPTAVFERNLALEKAYLEGRETIVRTHWRKQRVGPGRMYKKRTLIWAHTMRLPDLAA